MRAALDYASMAALQEIMDMLGLQRLKLNKAEEHHLLDMFYSMPYAQRTDTDAIEAMLKLALRLLNGVGRSTSQDTIRKMEELLQLLREIVAKANSIAGK